MKKVNVWEVEVWYPEEEEWKEYQYYSFSDDSSVILRYLEEDEGRCLRGGLIPDFQIYHDDVWSMDEFYKMVGEESSHSLICDFKD